MKNYLLVALICCVSIASVAQEEEKEKLKYTMFSAEASHAYNGYINKNGINAKFYFWVNKTYNFGPEFYFYFPIFFLTPFLQNSLAFFGSKVLEVCF